MNISLMSAFFVLRTTPKKMRVMPYSIGPSIKMDKTKKIVPTLAIRAIFLPEINSPIPPGSPTITPKITVMITSVIQVLPNKLCSKVSRALDRMS